MSVRPQIRKLILLLSIVSMDNTGYSSGLFGFFEDYRLGIILSTIMMKLTLNSKSIHLRNQSQYRSSIVERKRRAKKGTAKSTSLAKQKVSCGVLISAD